MAVVDHGGPARHLSHARLVLGLGVPPLLNRAGAVVIDWIILGVWILGALLTFRPVTRAIVRPSGYGHIRWDDVIVGSLLGIFVSAVFWPFAVAWFVLKDSTANDPARAYRVIAGESKGEKLKRLETEQREREAHIRRLERELGIGVDS